MLFSQDCLVDCFILSKQQRRLPILPIILKIALADVRLLAVVDGADLVIEAIRRETPRNP